MLLSRIAQDFILLMLTGLLAMMLYEENNTGTPIDDPFMRKLAYVMMSLLGAIIIALPLLLAAILRPR